MAKHYSKRASKKRAYKKRRTIRKLRNTIRRKIHMVGGGPEQDLFDLLFPLITKLAPGVFTLVMKNLGPFLQIFILLGSAARGGSKNHSNQRGGASLLSEGTKQRLTNILGKLEGNFAGNTEVLGCIGTLKSKFAPVPTATPPSPPPLSEPEPEIDLSNLQADLDEVPVTEAASPPPNEQPLDKFKRIFNDKVKGSLDRKIASVSSKFTPEERTCLITLKEAVLSDVVSSIRTKIDGLKQNKEFLREMAQNAIAAGKDALLGKWDAFKNSEYGQVLSAKKDAFKNSEYGQLLSDKKNAFGVWGFGPK